MMTRSIFSLLQFWGSQAAHEWWARQPVLAMEKNRETCRVRWVWWKLSKFLRPHLLFWVSLCALSRFQCFFWLSLSFLSSIREALIDFDVLKPVFPDCSSFQVPSRQDKEGNHNHKHHLGISQKIGTPPEPFQNPLTRVDMNRKPPVLRVVLNNLRNCVVTSAVSWFVSQFTRLHSGKPTWQW